MIDTKLIFSTVNELSNTIDLPSTLLRAQALFRRFQRTVHAIDKKNSFPAPSVRQRKPRSSEQASAKQPAKNTGTDVNGARPGSAEDEATAKEKVISPELRGLLSRKVEVLEKGQIAEHGGGV